MKIFAKFKRTIEIKEFYGQLLLKGTETGFTKPLTLPDSLKTEKDLEDFYYSLGKQLFEFATKNSKKELIHKDEDAKKASDERKELIKKLVLQSSEIKPANKRESVKIKRKKIEDQQKRLKTMKEDLKSIKEAQTLKASDAAKILGFSTRTLRRKSDSGWIKCERPNGSTGDREYKIIDIIKKIEDRLIS